MSDPIPNKRQRATSVSPPPPPYTVLFPPPPKEKEIYLVASFWDADFHSKKWAMKYKGQRGDEYFELGEKRTTALAHLGDWIMGTALPEGEEYPRVRRYMFCLWSEHFKFRRYVIVRANGDCEFCEEDTDANGELGKFYLDNGEMYIVRRNGDRFKLWDSNLGITNEDVWRTD